MQLTKDSTGHDWKNASDAERKDFSASQAKLQTEKVISVTTDILFDSLSAFYNTDDNKLLDKPLIQMVAYTMSIHCQSPE